MHRLNCPADTDKSMTYGSGICNQKRADGRGRGRPEYGAEVKAEVTEMQRLDTSITGEQNCQ